MLCFKNLRCETACSGPMTPMSLKMRRSSESHHRAAHQGFTAGHQWPASDVTATASVFVCETRSLTSTHSVFFTTGKTWRYFTSLNTLFLLLLVEMWMHCNINWCFLRLSSSHITLWVHLAGLIKPVCLHGWRRQNYKAKVMRLCSPNSCFTAAGGI